MHLGMTECHIPFLGHCHIDLWPSFKNYCVQSISLIFFEVGIPNLVCICILGWRSVTYHFVGHCSPDLWPSYNNYCVQSISLILFEIGIPNLVWWCILGWLSVMYNLWVTVTLTLDQVFGIIISGAHLLSTIDIKLSTFHLITLLRF